MASGMKDIRLGGRKFHPSCFTCQFCHRNIANDFYDSLDRYGEQKVHLLRGLPCCDNDWKQQAEKGLIGERGRLADGAIEGQDEHVALKKERKKVH
jgi:hypothetical protein